MDNRKRRNVSDFNIFNKNFSMKKLAIILCIFTSSETPKDWDIFIEALIFVESRGNDSIIGKNNDVGCLQITPIIVKSANQIIGYEKYTLDDRFSREKSIEIFNVIQEKHNAEKDKHFALKIWNPKASVSYHKKVMNKYNELKESRLEKLQTAKRVSENYKNN